MCLQDDLYTRQGPALIIIVALLDVLLGRLLLHKLIGLLPEHPLPLGCIDLVSDLFSDRLKGEHKFVLLLVFLKPLTILDPFQKVAAEADLLKG